MTINDVDVSECEFYDNYECNCHISECWEQEDRSKMMCEQVDDCYYKQLKRLEAENERLKEEILKWQTAYSRQYPINENKGYNKKEEQYRQTLQEIKAIAEENKFYFVEGTIIRYETIKQIVTNFEKILDLITKAEEE